MELQHLAQDDECPLCQSGTVEVVNGEVRCRGECGTVWTDAENVFVCCTECDHLYSPEEMADTGRCQTCEDWIVKE
jgi:hypothetical protein